MSKISRKVLFVVLLVFSVVVISFTQVSAQEPEYMDPDAEGELVDVIEEDQEYEAPEHVSHKAEVLEVKRIECTGYSGGDKPCQLVKVRLDNGVETEIEQDLNTDVLAGEWDLEAGDKVVVNEFAFDSMESQYEITEIYRSGSILVFLIIYILLVLAIGRMQGLGSLVGLVLSVLVLLEITIPMTLNGWNPILVALFGGFLVLIPSIYFSHGFNKKTTIALIGTSIGLFVTGILAVLAISMTRLTGFGAEESLYLLQGEESTLDMSSILFASMIIGGIGLIDDVTVSQIAIIKEIYEENKSIGMRRLYTKAMNVGRDHIASMVNTLFLAYAAASLPLLMLLVDRGASISDISNIETFAEEIIRTLVASSGLVLTLPITTLLGAYVYTKNKK